MVWGEEKVKVFHLQKERVQKKFQKGVTKSFGVVLTWELEVLDIHKAGGAKRFNMV